jgi:rare lipoprotein A
MVPPLLPVGLWRVRGCNVCSIGCARNLYFDTEARRIPFYVPLLAFAGSRKAGQLFVVALTSVTLAACAQPSVVNNRSELLSTSRQAPFATDKHAAEKKIASYGLASFYADGTLTASGEKFDPHELTAAHPTLPFGTRLRVTNVATGRSVIVRVNDRGPFVPGRVVDVSYSAGEMIGIIGRGVAKVKIDVVQ